MEEPNAFIFNWIENYEKQVNRLKETLENLNNNVRVYNHLTYNELEAAVEEIRKQNFELYNNYVSIIILDNKCKSDHFIKTSDNEEVLLHSEILTPIQTNSTFQNKPRLFVIQKLFDTTGFDDDDDDDAEDKMAKKVYERSIQIASKSYQKAKTLYQGTTVTIKAQEFSENFQKSPFIEVFCNEMEKNAETMPISDIYTRILCEIKRNRKYKIDITIGTNNTPTESLVFGSALNENELRDFLS